MHVDLLAEVLLGHVNIDCIWIYSSAVTVYPDTFWFI